MTTEREMRQADKELDRLAKTDFGEGKRLKSLSEMPDSQRINAYESIVGKKPSKRAKSTPKRTFAKRFPKRQPNNRMASGSAKRATWKERRTEKKLNKLLRKKEHMVRMQHVPKRDWLRIFVLAGIGLTVVAWLGTVTVCTFYKPPHYYDWQVSYKLGGWVDAGEYAECRMNLIEMIKRGHWDALRTRGAWE